MGIPKLFVALISAGALILVALASLLPTASAIQSRAAALLSAEVQQYQKAFTYGSQTEIRLKQGASALVEAVGMWDRDAELIFPDQSYAPHIYDVAIMRNLTRLETLRAAAKPHAWEPFNVSIDSLFFCSSDVYSVCLLISARELANALNVSKGQLVHGLFKSPDVVFTPAFWLGCVVVLGCALIAWVWIDRYLKPRHSPASLDLTGRVQAQAKTQAQAQDSPKVRHDEAPTEDHLFTMGDLVVDCQRMVITRGTHSANISVRDLKLLSYLHQHPNQVVSKDRLYNAGWGRDFVPSSRSLEQHIATLRKKSILNVTLNR